MSKLQSVIVSDLAKRILTRNPIVKRRTPLWFFTEECRKSWIKDGSDKEKSKNNRNAPKRNQIWECWRNMDLEAKRRYFNMAELDNVRFKEEQAERIARISSLLRNEHTYKKESCKKEDEEDQSNNDYFAYLSARYQRNYEKMVQAKSTRELYKEVIQKMKGSKSNLTGNDELVTAVPEDYRSVLARPRRPPPPFVLFTCDEKERINEVRKNNQSTSSFFKTAGDEWANAKPEKRAIYEKKYNNLVLEYSRAMLQFKKDNMSSEESYLEQASKERRALKKSLRKRLRDCDVLPLNVRNAFNFFLMDHKDVPLIDLTKIWRELPEEAKTKYRMLTQEDLIRYHKEKMSFDNFLKQMQTTKGIKES